MIVVGTAGHIDHGKSSIVRRLTGTDPDRLPEEKARGMTIDLGFAFYTTPDGEDIAFIDVPGHERFVKNMISGTGGIDVAMLVVAADDGWMPQSQEHFQVVRLLGIRDAIIVINKIDLVQRDWIELIKQDIKTKVARSIFEGAPILVVSAETGEGFEALGEHLNVLPQKVRGHADVGKARLYIDRAFVRPGMGGVVTGTLRGGRLSVGQQVSVWPTMTVGKVRTLQSMNRDVTTAIPGQRTAVSFTGIDKDVLQRGGVVSDRLDLSFFRSHKVLALALELIPEAAVSLTNRRRILLMVGTTEVEGEIRLPAGREMRPGESGVVFFKPEEPIYCLVGDHFIARLPTPMVTLGGGTVLDHLPSFPGARRMSEFEYLTRRVSGHVRDLVLTELEKRVIVLMDRLLEDADVASSDVDRVAASLVDEGSAARFEQYVFERDTLARATEHCEETMAEYLSHRPHLTGVTVEQLARLSGFSNDTINGLVAYLLVADRMTRTGEKYDLVGRAVSLKGPIKEAHQSIMQSLNAQPYAPPSLSALAAGGRHHKEAIKYIIDSGAGYKCGSEFLFLSKVWNEIVEFIKTHLNGAGTLTVGDLKERFGFTRKFAIPILEETDRLKLTRRDGDIRVKGDWFDKQESAV